MRLTGLTEYITFKSDSPRKKFNRAVEAAKLRKMVMRYFHSTACSNSPQKNKEAASIFQKHAQKIIENNCSLMVLVFLNHLK